MTLSSGADRARAMSRRVQRALGRLGLLELDGGMRVVRLLDRALVHRVERVDDDHDPRLLHPARTVLILLDDVGCRSPELLAAGAVLESRFPEMELPREGLLEEAWTEGLLLDASTEDALPDASTGGSLPLGWTEGPEPGWILHLRDIPRPWPTSAEISEPTSEDAASVGPDSELLEALVGLPPGPLSVVLAEALDQLRHLHMEAGRPGLPRGVELVRQVYRPLAVRVAREAPVLLRRFDWWEERLGRVVEG